MILPIYVYGSGVLRERAAEIDVNNAEGLQELIDNMYVTMKESDGVGIAAPQVGKSIRLLIVDGADLAEDMPELEGFKRVMINPVATWESEETAEYSEGCLSVPNIHADVIRPKSMKVKYLDEKFEEHEELFEGFACRMVQHEMDHLDGHLFIDHVSPIRKKMIQSKLNNIASGKVRTHYRIVKK
ncbi:MAG: peptide deformylase [Bacteroidales bacterium]|nr:peptide deformylase [Bacteroidales bacterium]